MDRKAVAGSAPSFDEVRPLSSVVKTLVSQWPQIRLADGLLVRDWLPSDGFQPVRTQLIAPATRREEIFKLSHGGFGGGHLGLRKTLRQLQKRAYWPGWREDVRRLLRRCSACAQYIRGKVPRQGQLQDMSVGEPWERVGVDITGPHPPSSKGHRYILTCIDYFTRWAEAFPIRSQDAHSVADVLVTQVFSRFGFPLQLLTDQGPCFEATLFQRICQLLHIDKLRTSPYKPSTNGRVERLHRTLNSMLAKLITGSQRTWDFHLPFVMSAYRSTEHEGTGYPPCRLFLGRDVTLPIDLVMSDCQLNVPSSHNVEDYVDVTEMYIKNAFALVREFTQRLVIHRTARYGLRVKPTEFEVGTWVWYHYPRRRPDTKEKWAKFYTGPYRII